MQSLQTPRYKLPLLATGQAHKERFHNEALTLLDFLVCPIVQAKHSDPNILVPSEGKAWLVDANPTGDWVSRTNQIAIWTAGGWRFVEPNIGAEIFIADANETAIFRGNNWVSHGAIVGPEGGSVIDIEARIAIDSMLEALRIKAVIEG